jgi:hypothetical protein
MLAESGVTVTAVVPHPATLLGLALQHTTLPNPTPPISNWLFADASR